MAQPDPACRPSLCGRSAVTKRSLGTERVRHHAPHATVVFVAEAVDPVALQEAATIGATRHRQHQPGIAVVRGVGHLAAREEEARFRIGLRRGGRQRRDQQQRAQGAHAVSL
jgi:hypothetical protein